MLSPEEAREVRAIVKEADAAYARREFREYCGKIWDATTHAIKCVAKERGWPHSGHDEITDAGWRLVAEFGAVWGPRAELGFAELYRDNWMLHVIQDYEVEEDWEFATGFIERILGGPARSSE